MTHTILLGGLLRKNCFWAGCGIDFRPSTRPRTPRFRLISGGECYDRSDNECGAGRGGGPHSTWGRGDVLRELHDLYVTLRDQIQANLQLYLGSRIRLGIKALHGTV